MKKYIISIAFLLYSLGNLNAQSFPFYSLEAYSAELGINNQGANTYAFDPTDFLIDYGLDSGVEYSCLWSFGDGQYSTEFSPTHTYPIFSDPKNYQVVLYATPIYSPLGPPPAVYLSSSDLISVGSGTTTSPVYNDQHDISLSYNRLPRASYESTFILTYRNITNSPATFPVHFYFNDNYFEYNGIQAPGGENLQTVISLNNVGNGYTKKLTFSNTIPLASNEERTVFIQMTTKAAAIGDINIDQYGQVDIDEAPALYALAKSSLGTSIIHNDEVEMRAVGSWDPNNKIASIQHINRDDAIIPRSIRYRINFENIGTASTSRVRVIDKVSPLLDFSGFRLLGDKKNHGNLTITKNQDRTITFDFNNLILEGTNSSDNVNLDDCRYWLDLEFAIDPVAFENHFGSSVSCNSSGLIGDFGTDAEIIFDSHQSIFTNTASTEVYCEVINRTLPLTITNVYPNPTAGRILVSYQISRKLDLTGATITLVDINSGVSKNVTISSALDGSVGMHEFPLDLSNENPGAYVVVIQKSNLIFESSTFINQ